MNFKVVLLIILFPAMLAGNNLLTLSNNSNDSVFVSIKFTVKNYDTLLFKDVIYRNSVKSFSIPKTDSVIGGIDVKFYTQGEKYSPLILKKAYCHKSDLSVDYRSYHQDSIFLNSTLSNLQKESIEMLSAICKFNEISFILQKDIPKYGVSVPNPYSLMDLLTKFYLNSETIDLYKLKKLYDYCSYRGNDFVSKENLEKQMNRFDTTKWTYLYEYKQLKAYIEHLNKVKDNNKIDYSFLNLKQQEEKLSLNSKKITVFVFWSTPCGKIKCFPYFEKLSIWKNKLKSLDFITISSENTNEGWKDGIARCSLKLWKNYRSTKESMDPMAIDYKISNVYQSFLILGKDNEVLFKTADYEKLDNYFKSNF